MVKSVVHRQSRWYLRVLSVEWYYDYCAAYLSTRFLVRGNPGKFQVLHFFQIRQWHHVRRKNGCFTLHHRIPSYPRRRLGEPLQHPSAEAKVLTKYHAGRTLTVQTEMNGWFKAEDLANGAIG